MKDRFEFRPLVVSFEKCNFGILHFLKRIFCSISGARTFGKNLKAIAEVIGTKTESHIQVSMFFKKIFIADGRATLDSMSLASLSRVIHVHTLVEPRRL